MSALLFRRRSQGLSLSHTPASEESVLEAVGEALGEPVAVR
ncbi:MAG: hypothetical protein WDM88_05825 [Galbitalea sp.]